MSQFLRPTSDVSKSNLTISTGSYAYAVLDEETPASDYIKCNGSGETNVTGYAIMHITDPVAVPTVKTGHFIRFSVKTSISGRGDPKIELLQGTTVIATLTVASPTTSYVTYSLELTEAEANNITDYTDLRLKVYVYHGYYVVNADNHPIFDSYCQWCEMEIPDASPASGPGLEMGMVA